MSCGQLYELQEDQVSGPAHWSQQPRAKPQAWGKVSGKLVGLLVLVKSILNCISEEK